MGINNYTELMMSNLSDQLMRDEGFRQSAYQDNLGYWTIGVGRMIDGRLGGGITQDEATYLLNNDIARVTREVALAFPWSIDLDEARLGVLQNMAFQLGVPRLKGFVNTLNLIKNGKYQDASQEMLNSTWAKQTPARAQRLSKQMLTGEWQ